MDLVERIRRTAADTGLAGIGVCDAAPFDAERAAAEERLERGFHAGMRFTYADPVVATDVRRSFPWAARLVVVAQPWAPGWRATVDGERAPLVRTNVAGLGVVTTAGRHSITFEYHPWSWRGGVP